MFYIWHTLLIILFITMGFILGYKLGYGLAKKRYNKEIPSTGKCPAGF